MKLYKFKKYRKIYKKLFEKEKKKLLKILPKAKIEHIGSTSIPWLGGKGIIDIIIGVSRKEIKNAKKILIKNKYLYREIVDTRMFFKKEYGFLKKRIVHVHLTGYKNKVWRQAIKFKNYLMKNKELREEYSRLKKQACRICRENGKIYRAYKNDFIKKILKK